MQVVPRGLRARDAGLRGRRVAAGAAAAAAAAARAALAAPTTDPAHLIIL